MVSDMLWRLVSILSVMSVAVWLFFLQPGNKPIGNTYLFYKNKGWPAWTGLSSLITNKNKYLKQYNYE
jgi:hypothetical protein